MASKNQIHVELLDANQEHVADDWTFSPLTKCVIRIGRSHENDIVISDRYVSRFHAELRFRDGFWEIVNLGQHGILRQGRRTEDVCRLEEHDELQLGGSGIMLRFSLLDRTPMASGFPETLTTLVYGPATPGRIAIDRADLSRAVGEIAESPYFRELRSVRKKLEGGRASGE
jgi:predicted component of type VI protein secretion system